MKELYAKKRRENRFRFGWVLLFLCALVWMIEGGVCPFVLGAAAIFLATVERAKAYANVPMPSMYTKEEGLAYWKDWFKKVRNTPSFGESVRDGKFAVVEYFWRIYIGMIPAILLCMVLYGVVAWRILLPWSMIIPAIAAFDVIPVVALALYAISVSKSLKSGRTGRGIADFLSRVITRCGSIAVLILMAVRAADDKVSENLRDAIGWINVREKAVIALESNFDWKVSDIAWIAWILVVLALILFFFKRLQSVGVILYIVLLLVVISPLKLRNYVSLSEDRLHVNEGFFDFGGTDIDLAKHVESYRVYVCGNARFEYPGFGVKFLLKDGSTAQFEWYDYRSFPMFLYSPSQFLWDLNPNGEMNCRFDVSFGYVYATDTWAEEYENHGDFVWNLVEKMSSLGIKGELWSTGDKAEKGTDWEKELVRKLSEKLPLVE